MPTLDVVNRTAYRTTLALVFTFLALFTLRMDLGRWSEPAATFLDSTPGISGVGAFLFLAIVVSALLWKITGALALRHH